MKQSSVSRIFKGLSSKLRERKSISSPPSHPQPSHRSVTVSEARRRRLSVLIRDREPPLRARAAPPSPCLPVASKAPLTLQWMPCPGVTPPPLRHNPAAAGVEWAGAGVSARVQPSAVFKGGASPRPSTPLLGKPFSASTRAGGSSRL